MAEDNISVLLGDTHQTPLSNAVAEVLSGVLGRSVISTQAKAGSYKIGKDGPLLFDVDEDERKIK